MTKGSTAIIIGGGVIGGAVAFELAKRGIRSTIVDKGALFSEASTASAGMLCPGAEILDAKATTEIFHKSLELHRAWTEEVEEISAIPVQYVNRGMLRVVFSEEERQKYQGSLSNGGPIRWVTSDEIRDMEPDVRDDNLGGVFFGQDGQLHPIHLAKSLERALQRLGCVLKPWVPALGLIAQQDRVIGVRTPDGDLFADYTIVAAGAWSSSLLKPIGLHLPVFPVKGQMYAVRSGELTIHKTVQCPGGMIVPRLDGSFTVGVTHEAVGFDKTITASAIAQIHTAITQFVPKLKTAEFRKTWTGLRPGTPDGLPYIGEIPGYKGLITATGHYTIGILLAPITGRVVAEMIHNEPLSLDVHPFRPERFQNRDPHADFFESSSN